MSHEKLAPYFFNLLSRVKVFEWQGKKAEEKKFLVDILNSLIIDGMSLAFLSPSFSSKFLSFLSIYMYVDM